MVKDFATPPILAAGAHAALGQASSSQRVLDVDQKAGEENQTVSPTQQSEKLWFVHKGQGPPSIVFFGVWVKHHLVGPLKLKVSFLGCFERGEVFKGNNKGNPGASEFVLEVGMGFKLSRGLRHV